MASSAPSTTSFPSNASQTNTDDKASSKRVTYKTTYDRVLNGKPEHIYLVKISKTQHQI